MIASFARRAAAPLAAVLLFAGSAIASPAFAAEAGPLDGPGTAWLLTATALVLFMTLPGLALFYAGLVRARNALSVLMHCVLIAALASVLWLAAGYSLAFTDGGDVQAVIGGLGRAFLAGVTAETLRDGLPEAVFFMFQLTFAVITPALIVGAYPERVKFSAVVWFSGLWLFLVYVPICHWIWGNGWLAQQGVIDFAGGLVVHVTAGMAAVIAALMVGKRRDFPHEPMLPHSPGMTATGAGMLWVGWYGFNAGSALAANGSAGMAMIATHMSAAGGALTWMAIEWLRHGRPSLVGIVTGLIAGLATITPAAGVAGPAGGLLAGICGSLICFSITTLMKQRLRLDDSLDVFAVHGIGGALGIVLVAVIGQPGLGGTGFGAGVSAAAQLGSQLLGLGATAAWAGLMSWIILAGLKATLGLRVSQEQEFEGLDITVHGERAYDLR
ncbi:MAG TPA: ammonium transporter [Ferrovibrio sp.]|uniref:ammonium transporter n=1 Tax=Ferrovibrio sp. TaxID=1917215 RepID=UPI002ED3D400